MVKGLRVLGWTLLGAGVLVLLYVVYLLFFTSLVTDREQGRLLEEWSLDVGDPTMAGPGDIDARSVADVDPGGGYAVIWFERPSTGRRIVHDEPLVVVEGTTPDRLRRGPGHYAATAAPGGEGNFAVSGHRTTYGAPFYDLDQLRDGDEVHVVDRQGDAWVYEVVEQRVVGPGDVWTIDDDPLRTGRPLMTLTTCHPRFSAAQRLIVWAELRSAQPH